jgi:hypothetical protein
VTLPITPPGIPLRLWQAAWKFTFATSDRDLPGPGVIGRAAFRITAASGYGMFSWYPAEIVWKPLASAFGDFIMTEESLEHRIRVAIGKAFHHKHKSGEHRVRTRRV